MPQRRLRTRDPDRRGRVFGGGTSPGHLCDTGARRTGDMSKVTPVSTLPCRRPRLTRISLQPTGARRQPSTRRAIGANLGCLRIVRAGRAPEPDRLLNQPSVRGGFVAISASSSRRHRVSGARLGRETENPQTHLLAILFFRPGARTPDRRPTNPRAHLTATSLLPAINRLRAHRHRPTTNRR